MKLEHLFPRITLMSDAELAQFMQTYREERLRDIDIYKQTVVKKNGLSLSPEEKALMKKLGLTMRTIQAFASATQTNNDEEDDGDVEPDA